MQKQMEDQQIEMIQFREAIAREKEAAPHVQTLLLKQIETQRKSQSFLTAEGNVRTLPSPSLTQDSAHFTESSRRDQSETYKDGKDSGELQVFLNPEVSSRSGYHGSGQGAAQPGGPTIFKGDGVPRGDPLTRHCQEKSPHSASRRSS